MTPEREPMSNVDTAWLHMDSPTNLMMITGVLFFEKPLSYEALADVLRNRLLKFKRFQQRVINYDKSFKQTYWETVPDFKVEDHLIRIEVPEPGDKKALQTLVGQLMSTPLDFNKPLWQFHFIENYQGGSAVIGRLHHCIADGTALVRVLLSLTDETPDPVEAVEAIPGVPSTATADPRHSTSVKSWRLGGRLYQQHPQKNEHLARWLQYAKLGAGAVTTLSKLVFRPFDPKTLFRGELGVQKTAAWSNPLSLADVKAIGKSLEGTVNDVLLTAMVGGLRRYLVAHGQTIGKLNIHAAVPVNLRPIDAPLEMGNYFGLVFPSLPVGIEDPVKRLKVLHRRMDAIKRSPEAMVTFGVLQALGMAPGELESFIVNFLGRKSTAVMTNVPGPRETIYLAGVPLKSMMFWVPQSGRVGMGISIMSYAGKVYLGVTTDARLVPDPDTIIEGFYEEFDALLSLVK
ncbi:MAG: wax ester/triacylglycerol synthase family O-acyltransferase [Calditrichaeota bacterium]|nr:MAG: wax ester/triacylglycerol synthase family O-acyltransferase [Calditrichota bacterium]